MAHSQPPRSSQLAQSRNARHAGRGVEGDRQRRQYPRDDRYRRGQGRLLGRRRSRTIDSALHRRAEAEDEWDRTLLDDRKTGDIALLRGYIIATPVIVA